MEKLLHPIKAIKYYIVSRVLNDYVLSPFYRENLCFFEHRSNIIRFIIHA